MNTNPTSNALSQLDDSATDVLTALLRNGYLPERSIQTGIGDVTVKVPKMRDRSGNNIIFNRAVFCRLT